MKENPIRFLMIAVCMLLIALDSAFSQTEIVYGSNPGAGRYARVNDIQMYYEVYGTGHPLLLMHGNGGSIHDMRNQIAGLSKNFKVIAVDSRAQGKTSDSDRELTFTLIASDMAALLDQLGLDSVYVVGYSDGGIVGLQLAYAFPRKVAKLVAISANFTPDSNAFSQELIENDKVASFAGLDSLSKDEVIHHSHFPERAPLIFDKLLDLDRKYPNFSVEQLGAILAPTLVMAGDRDLIKASHTFALFHALQHSQLSIIPGTTHGLPHQKPLLVNQIISEFLEAPAR